MMDSTQGECLLSQVGHNPSSPPLKIRGGTLPPLGLRGGRGSYSKFLNDKKGVSLVEVMIALVVLLLVMTGLLQSALLSIDHNLRNVLRDEAVKIAEQRMNGCLCTGGLCPATTCPASPAGYAGLRTISFDSLGAMPINIWTALPVSRNFRNLTKSYNVCWRITPVDTDTTQIEVAVGWDHRNENVKQAVGAGNGGTLNEYVHQITTLRRR